MEVPDTGADLVAATASCVTIGTLAEMDGETTVRLTRDAPDNPEPPIFEGFLNTPSCRVAVSLSSGTNILSMDVAGVRTRLTLWANDQSEPDLIIVRAGWEGPEA